MPTIPYPDVPIYPGVPQLPRLSGAAAEAISIGLGEVQTILINALQRPTIWGIFDAATGAQIGVSGDGGNGFAQALLQFINGSSAPILSTNAFEYSKETRISDFPTESGSFASFNKVQLPGAPIVRLAFAGSASDRADFLAAIDNCCRSTQLVNVVTPEVTYANHSIERYYYVRRAESGVTLLLVEIALKEIRQVSAAYSFIQTPIASPQNPNAQSQTSSGMTQPAAPLPSVLKQLANLFPSLGSN